MNQNLSSATKTIAQGTIYGSLGTVFIRGLSVVGYSLVIRQLSLYNYGVFTLLISITGPTLAIILFGFDRIFVSSIAKARGSGNFGRVRALVQEYYGLVLMLLGGCLLGGYVLQEVLASHYDKQLVQYFWTLALFILSQLVFNMVQLVLEGYERLNTLALLQSVEALVRNVLIITLVLNLNITLLLKINSIAKFAAAGVGLASLVVIFKTLFRERPERFVLLGIFREHGKWEIARNIVDDITGPLQLWLIKIFVNVPAVAAYGFAKIIYSFIQDIVPIKGAVFPVISRLIASEKKLAYLVALKAKKYLILFYGVMYLASLAFLPVVIRLFFPQYGGETVIVFLVLLHLFVDGYKVGQNPLLYALEQQKFQFILFNFGLLLQVVLDVSFIYFWGVPGIIWSWHIQALALGIAINIYLARKLAIPMGGWKELIRFDQYDHMLFEKVLENVKRIFRRISSGNKRFSH